MFRNRRDVELIHSNFLFTTLLAPILWNNLEQLRVWMVNGNIHRRSIEEQSFSQPAFLLRNRREPFELFGVYDCQVESGLGAVVDKNGIHHLTSRCREAKRDIRDSQ